MTVHDVAKRLEISVSLVYRLVESGRLACSRHGMGRGVIRVSDEQLARYLENAASRPEAPTRPMPRPAMRLKHLQL